MDLLIELRKQGLAVRLVGDDKIAIAPKDKVTSELLRELKRAKPLLIQALQEEHDRGVNQLLAKKTTAWHCRECAWFMGEPESVCIIEFNKVTHMVPIQHLRDCPKRNPEIKEAIRQEKFLKWLDRN